MLCRHRAEFGNGDLKIGQDFEQKRLELHIGAVDLVDQQHRRDGILALDRVEQRPFDQIVLSKDLGLDLLLIAVLDLFELDMQHLLRVVPLVERGVGVEPFVALQADQLGAQDLGQHFGDLGLADPGFALQKQAVCPSPTKDKLRSPGNGRRHIFL